MSKLLASLLLCFRVIKQNKGYLNTSTAILQQAADNLDGYYVTNGRDMPDKGMIHVSGRMEPNIERCHHATQNGVKCKTINCLFLEFSI